ncbi:hypothetical protein [Lentibacillus sediminis]|uniref:hypothetical protein n=1 Tax=Lentibacillus sediminis TaxID=1940529 RepID=UPI001179B445|nr:hypothetical protein [Lentibacillus sediminis]
MSSQVAHCIESMFEKEEIINQPYPIFPYGRKIVDHTGDFMVFFYDERTNQVIYFFKEAEDYWFCC